MPGSAFASVLGRLLLLGAGIIAAWFLASLLNTPAASARLAPLPVAVPAAIAVAVSVSVAVPVSAAVPVSVPMPVAQLVPVVALAHAVPRVLAPITQTTAITLTTAVHSITQPGLATAAGPVLDSVGSLLVGAPLGGVVPPPPAPILAPPAVSIPTGVLPIAPMVAEPSGDPDAQQRTGAPDVAMVAAIPGSVPVFIAAPRPPFPAPQPGLPDVPGVPLAGGNGNVGGGARQLDSPQSALPAWNAFGSPLAIRMQIDDPHGRARLIADDPSFSPD